MESGELTLYLAASFLIGSIPFGWIIAKLWGIEDLRDVGSSNVGATNVVRTAGWLPGALTFLLDFAKGLVPMLYFPEAGIWYGALAVLGHCFSPFLSFRGGKGVSTTLGALVAFNPWIGGAAILVYGLTLAITRVSAIGSLFAMLAGLAGIMMYSQSSAAKLAVTLMVLVVLARHRENWNKLLHGVGAALVAAALLGAPATPAHAADEAPLVDFRGKAVDGKAKPGRIAALMPALAEVVVALGAENRLVAAPDYSRLPKGLKISPLGAYNTISPEVVYASHPDVVLASMDGNDSTMVGQLEKLGLRVVLVNTQSLADIVRSIELTAAAIGERANPKVAAFRKLIGAAKPAPRANAPRVFVQVGWDPLITISHATFIDELVRLAGGVNVFAEAKAKYPSPNPEEVIARDPDVIVLCRLTESGDEVERSKAFWKQFTKLKAIRSGKLFVMPVDWLTKPGFNLMDGVKELQRIL